ncbi:MAG: hypothetical protein GY696_34650 [Gammaproteobacteria bacterium]|nr:hypothetical protein [Gammaproteobacteria bacterium]
MSDFDFLILDHWSTGTLTWRADLTFLCNDYHKTILAAIALSGLDTTATENSTSSRTFDSEEGTRTLIIGMGCGSLAMYLYAWFPKVKDALLKGERDAEMAQLVGKLVEKAGHSVEIVITLTKPVQ